MKGGEQSGTPRDVCAVSWGEGVRFANAPSQQILPGFPRSPDPPPPLPQPPTSRRATRGVHGVPLHTVPRSFGAPDMEILSPNGEEGLRAQLVFVDCHLQNGALFVGGSRGRIKVGGESGVCVCACVSPMGGFRVKLGRVVSLVTSPPRRPTPTRLSAPSTRRRSSL